MPKQLLIAIDGPSGAGKSTVATLLAARLGYTAVDSGAMYRALALLALEAGVDPSDRPALGRLAASAEMRFEGGPNGSRFLLNGRDVTDALRSPEVTRAASQVSVHPEVRENLVERQRALGRQGGLVIEGRDIGTKVKMTNTTFTPSANAMFWRIMASVRREWPISQGSLDRSSVMSAMSAVSIAVSRACRRSRMNSDA